MIALISLTDVPASLRRMPLINGDCLTAVRVFIFTFSQNSIKDILSFVKFSKVIIFYLIF